LSYDAKETGIKGINTNCMMVYWEIAEKKAGLRVTTSFITIADYFSVKFY
jgi:hypothetical protein